MNAQDIVADQGVVPVTGMKPGWFIAAGIIMVLLGILSWVYAFSVSLASTVILGFFLIAGGVVQLVQAFAHNSAQGSSRWLSALAGLLIIVAGGILCIEPVQGTIFLTAFIAAMLMIGGVMRMYWAFKMRPIAGWWVGLCSGGVTFLIGVLLYVTLPWAGLLFVGTLIAVELIMAGISAICFGCSLRKVQKEFAATP